MPDLRDTVPRLQLGFWHTPFTVPDIVDILRPFLDTGQAQTTTSPKQQSRVVSDDGVLKVRDYRFGSLIRKGLGKRKSRQQLYVSATTNEWPGADCSEKVAYVECLVYPTG